ncbi:hypothetical protein [Streptomyces sp. H27-D2]|uniref:hypothetical protein n=1 Tax=Streptomyces sp. H27-D2 TaxID=3046304 RepID=UPI002DB5D5B0|nr:hypothetical protein [Streptomyces sp. H27-D2]MEC4015788.1 hypothetical protein [Streptomyces sp. H27-D2]
MNSASHLLPEDRPEFERILDDALHTSEYRPALGAAGMRLNTEQLRTMALSAMAAISACAAAEYEHFCKARQEAREPAPAAATSVAGGEQSAERGGSGGLGIAITMGEVTEGSGAGLIAVVAVLAPVLAGTAAAIFLLVGYALHMITPEPSAAQPLITAGWLFAALTAAGFLVAMAGMLLTALRNGANSVRDSLAAELPVEVAIAKDAWEMALLDRGMLPFLREALADPATRNGAAAPPYVQRRSNHSPTPDLGYSRPGFSSPAADSGGAAPRPRFSSPDFTSPDYGGPDHQPD